MKIVLAVFFSLTLFASERIIAFSPSIAEIVFALGKGSELVGVTQHTYHPKEAQSIEKVGGYFKPNLEKTISLNPTIVFAQPHNRDFLNKLIAFNIKTKVLNFHTLNEIKSSIKIIAELIHADQNRSEELIKNIDHELENAKKLPQKQRVLVVFGAPSSIVNGLYVAGKQIFYNDILDSCGAVNAYSDLTIEQPKISYEQIISLDPDQILILDPQHLNSKESYIAQFKELNMDAKIKVIYDGYISIPSYRVAQSIKKMCDTLYYDKN